MDMRYPRQLGALSAVFSLIGTLVALSAAGGASAQPPVGQGHRVPSGRQAKGHPGHRAPDRARSRHSIGNAVALNPAPTVALNPAPTTSQSSSDLLFKGTHISEFLNLSAPSAVTEVPDPAGSGESVFKMTVNDQDVYPITPTEDPRAELAARSIIIKPGDEFWWSSKFYLPPDFPSSVPSWLTLLAGPYGPPFVGPPPWFIEVNGEHIQWQRNGTYNWDIPWQMPLVRGSWVSVMVHGRFGTAGWVEMWVDGQQITFFNSGTYNPNQVAATQRLKMQTMDSSNNGGPNNIRLMNYRRVGMFNSVTLYEGPLAIGRTRASVEG